MNVKTEYDKAGEVVEVTAGSDITAGTPQQLDDGRVGIPTNDIDSGETDGVRVRGLFRGWKTSASISAGDAIGWDADGSPLNGTASSGAYTNVSSDWDFKVGRAQYAAGASAEEVIFAINEFGNEDVLDETGLSDVNGNEVVEAGATASAVNHVQITNAATGNAPDLAAAGDDTNVDLEVSAKGSGSIQPQSSIQLAADKTIDVAAGTGGLAYTAHQDAQSVDDATVGDEIVLEFDVDASAGAQTFTVPSKGKKLRILDAVGWKKTANGAHADDDIDITDGTDNIFDTKELNGVNTGVRFTFAGLSETYRDLAAGDELTITPGENGAGQGDCLLQIRAAWIAAS